MSDTALQTLHTAVGPIEVEMPTELSDTPDGSKESLVKWAQTIRFANSVSVYSRIMLGRQLILTRDRALWQHYGLEDCGTWSRFINHGFRRLTGMSRETAYAAMQLAECRALATLPPAELQRFENLANAIELTRLERQGPVSADLIEQAMTKPLDEFRAMIGKAGKTVVLEVVLTNPAVSEALGRVVGFLKLAEPDALEAFWKLMECAKLRAGDNPNDTIDCMIAACQFQWSQEDE